MVNSALIRPAISWGGGIGGVPFGSEDIQKTRVEFEYTP